MRVIKPQITLEQHQFVSLTTSENNFKIKGSMVSFPLEAHIKENGIIMIEISTTNEIYNISDNIISTIVVASLFRLENMDKSNKSEKVIEQIFYKAYGAMLDVYKKRYKNTIYINYDPCLPLDLSVNITNLLNALP